MIAIVLSSVVVSFVIFVVMLVSGNLAGAVIFIGIVGIVGLFVILFGTTIIAKGISKTSRLTQLDQLDRELKSLIDKAEVNPKMFSCKMRTLCNLGNIYISMLLVLFILSAIGVTSICILLGKNVGISGPIIVFFCLATYYIFKITNIQNKLPDMPFISRAEFPVFFRLLDETTDKICIKRMNRVYLSQDANCAVANHKIGSENYDIICVGIYLLGVLNKSELKSCFFHELAHISNKDTKISKKVSDYATVWENISSTINERGFLAQALLRNFSLYYSVKLHIYRMASSKQREFLADKIALSYSSPQVYATALAKTELIHYYLTKQDGFKLLEIRDEKTPPDNYYNRILSAFYDAVHTQKDNWLSQIKKRISTKYDYHLAFTDRLKAIKTEIFSDNIIFAESDSVYQNEIRAIIRKMNVLWAQDIAPLWTTYREAYLDSQALVDNYSEITGEAKQIEYGMALENINKTDKALCVYDKMLEENPSCASALFRKGQILLGRLDDNGLELVIKAVELDSAFIANGLLLIREYQVANGMGKRINELEEWTIEKNRIHAEKQAEASKNSVSDNYLPCDLDAETIEKIRKLLYEFESIKKAYLVKKELRYSTDNYYIIAIQRKPFSSVFTTKLVIELNKLGFVYAIEDLNTSKQLMKPISRVENAEIYSTHARAIPTQTSRQG
ncbi:MAG: M48 family metallopeptidase [Dehalococcoidia bacterium]|nr:M48 family metallopeptidase [Dehalococcoidia bacterium]